MPELTPKEQTDLFKEAAKEAITEWMDEKFAKLGKWSAGTIVVAALGALAFFILWTNGWRPPV